MARQVLTDRMLKALKPAPAGKRLDYMDAVVPGLGVRVTDKADKDGRAAQRTFILLTRYPGSSNPTRRSLGEYGALSLERAREKARDWLDQISRGIDPGKEAARQRETESRRQEQQSAETFGAIAEEYFCRHLKGQRRGEVAEREIRKELLSRWQDRPITEITRRDVVAMVDDIVDRGAKRQAHNIFGHARTIFNWAINRGLYGIEQSPCDRVKASALIGAKQSRERVLSDEELRAVWVASAGLGYPYGPLVRMLMLTGQRKAEVAEARWSEFDLDNKIWTIPPERFKSGSTHIVPLADDVLAILADLPRFGSKDRPDDPRHFLFSTTGGRKAVNGFSKAKERLDRIAAESGAAVPDWVLHDLRRTVRTRLSALRVADPVAEMVIGHARKGLQRVYDQHTYIDEMREALELWARRLRDILEPPPANVVRLEARAQ